MYTINDLQTYLKLQLYITEIIASENGFSCESILIDENFSQALHHVIYDNCNVNYCKKESKQLSNEAVTYINNYFNNNQKVESIINNFITKQKVESKK
jgi:hypothetical protein